jgi:hypothetical protein
MQPSYPCRLRDHGGMADDLDDLHRAKPEEFTKLRASLAEAAKNRGDTAASKQISAARKPTTAAWVVNRLALDDMDAKPRLTDLGERLRAAHAQMDGERIRELSAQQRSLIEELTRTAFERAGLSNPSAAMRDDVTNTLQAAIADPGVAARLGRLARAERWSGFGDFGDTSQVFSVGRAKPKKKSEAVPVPAEDSGDDERAEVRAALAAAERARAEADDVLSERKSDLAAARMRHDDLRKRMRDAERNLDEAENAYADAKRAVSDAAQRVKEAKARLSRGRTR